MTVDIQAMIARADDNNELAHYGVKGMKWGVRKDTEGRVKAGRIDRKLARDGKLNKSTTSAAALTEKHGVGAISKAAYRWSKFSVGRELKAVNNDPKYKDKDVSKGSLKASYDKDVAKAIERGFATGSTLATTEKVVVRVALGLLGVQTLASIAANGPFIVEMINFAGDVAEAKHSSLAHSDDEVTFQFVLNRGPKGHILDFGPYDPAAEHADIFDMTPSDALAHWGVKGMKWGVTRDRTTGLLGTGKSGDKDVHGVEAFRAAANASNGSANRAQKGIDAGLRSLNSLPPYNKMKAGDTELRKSYDDRAAAIITTQLQKSQRRTDLVRTISINSARTAIGLGVAGYILLHADDAAAVEYEIPIETDSVGRITKVDLGKIRQVGVSHSDILSMTTEEALAHWGVKGMKWGVRRSDAELTKARSVADRLADARGQDKTALVRTKKGYSTGEALAAAEFRDIAKRYGTSALSNSDLKQLNERLNLEANYAKMTPKQKTKLQKTLDGLGKAAAINKKLGNPAGRAAMALINSKTKGSTGAGAKFAAAAAAAAAGKAPKAPKAQKQSSTKSSSMPKAGKNLDFKLSELDAIVKLSEAAPSSSLSDRPKK